MVVPCYNEGLVLRDTTAQLVATIKQLDKAGLCSLEGSGILYVDDGSKDDSWDVIASLCADSSLVNGLRLSRNKGHQAALIAGLEAAIQLSDVTISVDADLQDDIAVCVDMMRLYRDGYHIVYGVRSDRSTDSSSKKFFANSFYLLMQRIGVEIIPGHADFRMISAPVLKELFLYQERALFLRGIIPQLGFKSASVYYARKKRQAGETKYPFRKSLSLAVDGILSLSNKPLRLITYLGLVFAGASIVGVITIILTFLVGGTVQGWASMMVVVAVLGGAQLLSLGIIGEYLGRVYKEVKRRPHYHKQEFTGVLFKQK
jgi:glycosyltransferase involved in cell wall biosynthesis